MARYEIETKSRVYNGILLSLTYKIISTYNIILFTYDLFNVNMQHNYVAMQYNLSRM